MKAEQMMTKDPVCCTPSDTAQQAARHMRDNDCGCLPVVEEQETRKLVGVVTDRDIALRAVAEGRGPNTRVEELMSRDPSCCGPGSDVAEAEKIMATRQVRRVPVVDGDGCCVGIIAQADIARRGERDVSDEEVGRIVERISEPVGGSRAEVRVEPGPMA